MPNPIRSISSREKVAAPKSAKRASESKGSVVANRPIPVLELRQQMELNQPTFARMLPISIRTLAKLENGSPPSEVVARRLKELSRLTNALTEVIRKNSLGAWLQTPNSAFDNLKPLEVIERGEGDRLWSMIYFLRSGTPF